MSKDKHGDKPVRRGSPREGQAGSSPGHTSRGKPKLDARRERGGPAKDGPPKKGGKG
jgi:hypothetical protein